VVHMRRILYAAGPTAEDRITLLHMLTEPRSTSP
jgi:hypothetical protein